jgi:hypothetical protein
MRCNTGYNWIRGRTSDSRMKYPALLLSLFLANMIGCSVAPALESPRIKPGIKLELDASNMQNEIKWHLTDSVMRGGVYSNELKFTFGENKVEYGPKIQFGISNRVEIGGYLWWLLSSGGWDGKIKINVLDAGKDVIFRNIAVAIIAGSKGSFGEWSGSNRTWAGITFGTLNKIKDFEFEYIIMPTIGTNHYNNLDDGLGSGGVNFTDVLITTGATISFSQRLYSSAAVILSAYKSGLRSYSSGVKINEITFTPKKIGLNFNIGWRFGG